MALAALHCKGYRLPVVNRKATRAGCLSLSDLRTQPADGIVVRK